MIHGGPPAVDAQPVAVAGANINIPPPDPLPVVMLGVSLVEIDHTNRVISIDVLNTFPETYWQGDKVKLGDVTLAVQDSQGKITPIKTLHYNDYSESAYEKGAGILDIKFDPKLSKQIADGTLIVQAVAGTKTVSALVEQPWMSSQTASYCTSPPSPTNATRFRTACTRSKPGSIHGGSCASAAAPWRRWTSSSASARCPAAPTR